MPDFESKYFKKPIETSDTGVVIGSKEYKIEIHKDYAAVIHDLLQGGKFQLSHRLSLDLYGFNGFYSVPSRIDYNNSTFNPQQIEILIGNIEQDLRPMVTEEEYQGLVASIGEDSHTNQIIFKKLLLIEEDKDSSNAFINLLNEFGYHRDLCLILFQRKNFLKKYSYGDKEKIEFFVDMIDRCSDPSVWRFALGIIGRGCSVDIMRALIYKHRSELSKDRENLVKLIAVLKEYNYIPTSQRISSFENADGIFLIAGRRN